MNARGIGSGWIHTWWGKLLLVFVFLVVAVSVLFLLLFLDNLRLVRTWELTNEGLTTEQFTPLAEGIARSGVDSAFVMSDDDPRFGNPNASLTIVAFEDFECPWCRQAFPIIRESISQYERDLLFVYRDFPLTDLHPNAQRAAEAAGCAHEQGKFWEYHDRLYQNQGAFADDDLTSYARAVGLDVASFTSCLLAGKYQQEVEQDFLDGVAAGVRGTPTFFFNGRRIEGVVPLEAFQAFIEAFLDAA